MTNDKGNPNAQMTKECARFLCIMPVSPGSLQLPERGRSFVKEVEKVDSDLVKRGRGGQLQTVRYDAVNAMLLNEFLKEHRTVEGQEATIAQLKSTVAEQQKEFQATALHQQEQIEALAAGLQKVSAQLELGRPAPRTVVNNQ